MAQTTSTQSKNEFINLKSGRSTKISDTVMRLEPRMLPPQFRRRTNIWQKIYVYLVVISYALAVGTLIYTFMGDFEQAFNIQTNGEVTYAVIALVSPVFILFVSGLYVYWSRSKVFLMSWFEALSYLSPAISMIIGTLYVSSGSGEPIDLYASMGVVSLITGILVVGITISRSVVAFRRYREALYRAVYVTPGMIVAAIAPFVYSAMLRNADSLVSSDLRIMLTTVILFTGGVVLMAIGITLSAKYINSGGTTLWKHVRYNGGLPTLTIYTSLLAVSMKFAFTDSALTTTPVTLSILMNLVLLTVFSIFLWFRARMKKMNVTNPLFNQIVLKSFVGLTVLIALVMVQLTPTIYPNVKSDGPIAFTITAVSAGSILIGITQAHFMNFITFSKYMKTTLGGMIFVVLLVLVAVASIATLKYHVIIIDILARNIAILFLALAAVVELLLLLVDISYLFTDSIMFNRKQMQSNKKIDQINAENDLSGDQAETTKPGKEGDK